jgi:arylsulfatase A-like enzyme
LGSQGERLKRKPWEESIRVPGILRWPAKVGGGGKRKTFFTHVDFAPTMLGMAGLRVPAAMQGRDLSRELVTGKGAGPDSAFFQIFGPFAGDGTDGGWRGVRTERFMYARYEDRPWVLYDVVRDPLEKENLVGRPEAAGVQREMEKRLADWMKKTGDSWSYNWTHPVEDAGRLYKHKTFRSVAEYLAWAKENPDKDRG